MVDLNQLTAITLTARCEGKKIVLTGGIFDLLHIGHLRYLQDAKTLGDLLIVEIGNDTLAAAKTLGRPIMPEEHRAELVAGLKPVDYVIITQDLTHKKQIIMSVRPDFYVRGKGWTMENFPERALVESLGGQAIISRMSTPDSTTKILKGLGL